MEQTSAIGQESKARQTATGGMEQNPPLWELRNVGEAERFGSILGGIGLLLAGLARRGGRGVVFGALGASLIQRGMTGHCPMYQRLGMSSAKSDRPGVPDNVGIGLERSVVINRSREELFAFWRHLPNLARVMRHVERIDLLDEQRSHWEILTPRGRRLSWDALIINEHPNEMLAWESLPGTDVENAGSVRFEPDPHGVGTVVKVKLEYNPPGGLLGRMGAMLLGETVGRELEEDLRQFKQFMESEQLLEK